MSSSRKRAYSDEEFVPDSEEERMDAAESGEPKKKKMKKKEKKEWKEEEELALVSEMGRYWEEKKLDPKGNKDDFLGFMRPEVLTTQLNHFSQPHLRNKILKLNKMYMQERLGAKSKGKVAIGSHKHKMFKVLDIIWGQKVKESDDEHGGRQDHEQVGQTCLNELFRYHTKIASRAGNWEDFLTQALDLIEEETLQQWDQQWKELQLQQMNLNVKAAKLWLDHSEALLQASVASSPNPNHS